MIWRYGLGLLFGMVALSLGAWIVQLVRSLQQRDLLRGLSLGFVLVYMGALVILGYVTILSGVTLPERVAIFILVGLGLVPLIYLVWSGATLRNGPGGVSRPTSFWPWGCWSCPLSRSARCCVQLSSRW